MLGFHRCLCCERNRHPDVGMGVGALWRRGCAPHLWELEFHPAGRLHLWEPSMGRADLLSQSGLAASSGAIKRRGCGRACIGADVPQVEGTGGSLHTHCPSEPTVGQVKPLCPSQHLGRSSCRPHLYLFPPAPPTEGTSFAIQGLVVLRLWPVLPLGIQGLAGHRQGGSQGLQSSPGRRPDFRLLAQAPLGRGP